jgi:hypothetical protein
MQLTDLTTQRYDIGKAAILAYSEDAGTTFGEWDGTSNLFDGLVHIGTTEGPIDIEPNSEYSDLTIEETGPAILKRYLSGESPSFEIGVFPTPAQMKAFSPTGTASAGYTRRPLAQAKTIWVVPQELFLSYSAAGVPSEEAITYLAGAFLKDGSALTDEEQELVDMSILIWKAQFGRLTPMFQHEDGGKSLKNVPIQVMQDFTKPNGCQLYLVMSEADDYAAIDFEPES